MATQIELELTAVKPPDRCASILQAIRDCPLSTRSRNHGCSGGSSAAAAAANHQAAIAAGATNSAAVIRNGVAAVLVGRHEMVCMWGMGSLDNQPSSSVPLSLLVSSSTWRLLLIKTSLNRIDRSRLLIVDCRDPGPKTLTGNDNLYCTPVLDIPSCPRDRVMVSRALERHGNIVSTGPDYVQA